jgi:bacterioferritin (cytochrome b1)
MTLDEILGHLNNDLRNEYKHLLFYMHAANLLVGVKRLYIADFLKAHATEEMAHVYQFAHKIRGWGGTPYSGLAAHQFPEGLTTAEQIIDYAIEMEQEVIANYHKRHEQAEELRNATGKHFDIALFLEEQIEHSQADVDELLQIQREWKN